MITNASTSIKNQKSRLFLFLAIAFSALLILAALFFKAKKTHAQTGLMNVFGGKITDVEYCCNGLILTVSSSGGDGGDYFINWADAANPKVNYSDYNIFVPASQNTVGEAVGVAACSTISSECESSETVQGGEITKIGTGGLL